MTFPTLHLNGTSAGSLLEGWERAHAALCDAMQALAQAAPNGRDFYVQQAGAFEAAQAEHEERMRRLHEVRRELEALSEHVAAEDLRRRSRHE
jgi:hypothetical protein